MEFCVGAKKYKYKGICSKGLTMIECVFIYGYVCIGLVGCALIGLIVFAWVAIRKLDESSAPVSAYHLLASCSS
jgi:hypothetical protein